MFQDALAQQTEFNGEVSGLSTMITEAQDRLQSVPEPEPGASAADLQRQLDEHQVLCGFSNYSV